MPKKFPAGNGEPSAEATYALLERFDSERGRHVSYLRRLVRTTEEAEDLLQEAYLKACRSANNGANYRRLSDSYDGFEAWMYKIARNILINRWRRRGREEDNGFELINGWRGEFLSYGGSDSSPNPEEILLNKELGELIDKEMSALPDEFREAAELLLVDEMSYAEAAKMQGIKLGTAKSRLFRARKILQERLAPHMSGNGYGKD